MRLSRERRNSMRKALIPALLLVVTAIVLGSTVFREQIAHAATTPFQQVVVQNTSTNPVPVTQIGTSTTSVTGTVGIDPNKNTVKLDSAGNTVNLDSTDAANLASVENDLGNLKFDGSGNLETTAPTSSPGPVTEQCLDHDNTPANSIWYLSSDSNYQTLCSGQDFYLTNITGGSMDSNLVIAFLDGNKQVLDLEGKGDFSGSTSYQMDLTHPVHVTDVKAYCASSPCAFTLLMLGNSTGT
jgi:hypothetical protein